MLSLSETPNSCIKFYDSLFLTDTNECIIWPFYKTPDGYGTIRIPGRANRRVNRNICLDLYGNCPENYQAAHSCGNPSCCNPKHLSWKSPKENCADKELHGTVYRGEDHFKTKLTENNIKFIRDSVGVISQRKLAKMFNISKGSIHFIQKGLTWKHL